MESAWINAIIGGAIIGIAASILLLTFGRVLGVSGIVGRIYELSKNDFAWRVMFLAGTMAGGYVAFKLWPENFQNIQADTGFLKLAGAGLLVGFGTKLGNGCTSGHGVCGIGRASPRGLAATCTFILFGILTVAILGL
jgi:uncharacterized membrane protein YedE/YeeE